MESGPASAHTRGRFTCTSSAGGSPVHRQPPQPPLWVQLLLRLPAFPPVSSRVLIFSVRNPRSFTPMNSLQSCPGPCGNLPSCWEGLEQLSTTGNPPLTSSSLWHRTSVGSHPFPFEEDKNLTSQDGLELPHVMSSFSVLISYLYHIYPFSYIKEAFLTCNII